MPKLPIRIKDMEDYAEYIFVDNKDRWMFGSNGCGCCAESGHWRISKNKAQELLITAENQVESLKQYIEELKE